MHMQMHRRPSRAFPVRGLLLSLSWSLSLALGALTTAPAPAQVGRAPSRPIPPTPAVTTPATPAVTTPARPAFVTPAGPAMPSPVQPAVVPPAKPAVTYPSSPGVQPVPWPITKPAAPKPGIPTHHLPTKPVPLPQPVPFPPGHDPDHDHGHGHHHPHHPYPIIVVPSYPAAYIGPEIISITTYPTESTPTPTTVPAPPAVDPNALQGTEATPRLVAILGRIQRVDGAAPTPVAGAGTRSDGDRLCLGLATLTVYHPASPDEPAEAMARGTYLGSRWDGDLWHTSATGIWSRGPVTRQPIFTLHEVQPSTWPFETARPGRRVTSMRMALALAIDPPAGPAASGKASTTAATSEAAPTSAERYVRLGGNLARRLQAANQPATSPNDTEPTGTYHGQAHSVFSTALSQSLQDLLHESSQDSDHQPSTIDHQPLAAEWLLPLGDLRDIMTGCPRFTTIPLPADLLTVRTRDTSPNPVWVRPFRIEVPSGSVSQLSTNNPHLPSGSQHSTPNSQPRVYQGEVWFVIVPDAGIRAWTSSAGTPLGAPLAPQ